MSENMNELHEMEEMRTAYQMFDERLDGQEIVSDEQLREAMYGKFVDIRRNAKEGLVWLNLILVPIFLWKEWSDNSLTLFGIIVMSVYWVASLLFRFFILRKTKKEDYGSYDLKTLTEKESRYQKNIKWGTIIFVLFWVMYFSQWVIGNGTKGYIFLVMMLVLLLPISIRYLIIKYKYNGEAIDPATGKPRVIELKWMKIVKWVFQAFLGILACVALVIFVHGVIASKGLYDVLSIMNLLPMIIVSVALLLAVLHMKKKITVPNKLMISLIAIAIVMSVGIIAVAYFMNFSNLCNPSFLFGVVCTSFIIHTFYNLRK
ncbi:MAG: hypothetical protein J5637_02475 [Prevotella sp.]|nr:hypothetical protein [Prevotella sp.]